MEKLLLEFLELSNKLRPNYRDSLGKGDPKKFSKVFANSKDFPGLVTLTYQHVLGTRSNTKEQDLMDFIPGFRLIHIDEYPKNLEVSRKIALGLNAGETFFPLLANYSSDFMGFAVNGSQQLFVSIEHDADEFSILHNDGMHFLKTIVEFYKQDVYFLDDEGYLDYDPGKEAQIGAQLNQGVEYWT